jgi:hypothetical protein
MRRAEQRCQEPAVAARREANQRLFPAGATSAAQQRRAQAKTVCLVLLLQAAFLPPASAEASGRKWAGRRESSIGLGNSGAPGAGGSGGGLRIFRRPGLCVDLVLVASEILDFPSRGNCQCPAVSVHSTGRSIITESSVWPNSFDFFGQIF